MTEPIPKPFERLNKISVMLEVETTDTLFGILKRLEETIKLMNKLPKNGTIKDIKIRSISSEFGMTLALEM